MNGPNKLGCYITLNKHSNLLGTLVSYEENECIVNMVLILQKFYSTGAKELEYLSLAGLFQPSQLRQGVTFGVEHFKELTTLR
jgi:hypothetical protein